MPTATLTSKGQVTIPAVVRDRLGLKTGDKLNFAFTPEGGVTLMPQRTRFEDVCGILGVKRGRPISVRQMDSAIARAVTARWRRATAPRDE